MQFVGADGKLKEQFITSEGGIGYRDVPIDGFSIYGSTLPGGTTLLEEFGGSGITSLPIDQGALALGEMRTFPIRRNPALFKTPEPFVNDELVRGLIARNQGAVDLAEMDTTSEPADDPNLMLQNLEAGRPERSSIFTTGDVVPDTVDSLFFTRGQNLEGGFRGIVPALLNRLQPFDNRVRPIQDFYGRKFGLDNIGRVASGPMKGYNPVSGGLLYGVSGGRFGQPTNIGLQRALEKRIATRKSDKTLARLRKNKADIDAFNQKTKELEDLITKERQERIRTAPADVRAQIEKNRQIDSERRYGLL
jgi:hypothetical protein